MMSFSFSMSQLRCEGCISTNAENDQSAVTTPISSPLLTGAEMICCLFHGKLRMAQSDLAENLGAASYYITYFVASSHSSQ